ncbi:hypothetical protein CASFOL_012562 [Castilleja foliolosa]|uniref:DOG1 domain-containing protein n=1 Tax=Castilleja foliolosa TaxID=1961234 RepID=A0ABD3DKV0_9LAMI
MSFQNHQPNWKEEQTRHLQTLTIASQNPTNPSFLSQTIEKVVAHYEKYHTYKTRMARQDNALVFLSPPWNTPFEDSLVWIGGWRPNTAFRVICTLSGQAQYPYLTTDQLRSLCELERIIAKDEMAITDEMAQQNQLGVTSMKMVELSHEMSKPGRGSLFDDDEKIDLVLRPNEEGFRKILEKADELRLRTIKGIVRVMTPIQAVHFLIAATELQLKVHGLGKAEEESQINATTAAN